MGWGPGCITSCSHWQTCSRTIGCFYSRARESANAIITPCQTRTPCAILCALGLGSARNLTSSVLGLYSEWSPCLQGPGSRAPSRLRLLLPKALPCHLLPRISCLVTSIATWVPSLHLSPETQDPQGIPPPPLLWNAPQLQSFPPLSVHHLPFVAKHGSEDWGAWLSGAQEVLIFIFALLILTRESKRGEDRETSMG